LCAFVGFKREVPVEPWNLRRFSLGLRVHASSSMRFSRDLAVPGRWFRPPDPLTPWPVRADLYLALLRLRRPPAQSVLPSAVAPHTRSLKTANHQNTWRYCITAAHFRQPEWWNTCMQLFRCRLRLEKSFLNPIQWNIQQTARIRVLTFSSTLKPSWTFIERPCSSEDYTLVFAVSALLMTVSKLM
jgi:hypothetical protein